MPIQRKRTNIFHTLVMLTALIIFTQLLFFGVIVYATGFTNFLTGAIPIGKLLSSKVIVIPLIQFIVAQLILYIYILWYIVVAISELFS